MFFVVGSGTIQHRRHEGRLGAMVALLVAAATLFAGIHSGSGLAQSPESGAAASGASGIRIVSPAHNGRVTGARLAARVRTPASRIRATLDGINVTRRFHRGPNGMWRATLKRGRDFGRGPGALTIAAGNGSGQDVAVAAFRVLRRDDERLRVTPNAERVAAPVSFRVRTTHEITRRQVRVNGDRVRGALSDHDDSMGLRAQLSPRHGLHYGTNRVTFVVEHADSTLSRVSHTITVPRTKPLPDAGRDRITARHSAVRLDGSATRAPRRSQELSYRWRVVDAPEGSSAGVESAERRPSFKPDLPGTYRVRLIAVARAGAGAAASASAADEVMVEATPTAEALGSRVQTITADGGIQIEDDHYPPSGEAKDWVHMLVVNSTTLKPSGPGDNTYSIGDYKTLINHAKAAGPDDLVIITGQGKSVQTFNGLLPSENGDALKQVFAHIGATINVEGSTYTGIDAFNLGAWSVIGQAGMTAGSAWQNYRVTQPGIPGFLSGSPGQVGSLNGYLPQVIGTGSQFVSPEFAAIDTKADGSTASRNVIKVGESTYTSEEIGGERAMGIQMLVLDGSTLAKQSEATFVLRNPDGSLNEDGLSKLSQALELAKDPPPNQFPNERFQPPLVIAQSFGNTDNANLRWVADSSHWVNDRLPDWGKSGDDDDPEFQKWCGDRETPRQNIDCYSQDQDDFPNTPEGLGDASTFTNGVGLMAGMPARTAVANFGRAVIDSAGKRVAAPEAVVLVGSAHAYNPGDVTVRVGEDGSRLVGTLRRTNQSQWTVSVPGNDPRFDTGSFWGLAMTPPQPWKLEPSSEPGMDEAHLAVINEIWPSDAVCQNPRTDPCISDVRDEYARRLSDSQWGGWRQELTSLVANPPATMSADGVAALGRLGPLLATEFLQVNALRNLFVEYENVFTNAQVDIVLNMTTIGGSVMSAAFRDSRAYQTQLESEKATVDSEAPFGDAFYFAADIFDLFPEGEFVGGPLSLLASGWDLFSSIAGSDTSSKETAPELPDYPNLIRDEANQLGTALADQYDDLKYTFIYLLDLFASDPIKLATAAANANNLAVWGLEAGGDPEKFLSRSIAMATKAAFFNGLMPVAYDNWVVAPTNTSTGNEGFSHSDPATAGPSNYHCDDGPNPFQSYPAKADDVPPESLHWVRFEQSSPNSPTPLQTSQNRDSQGVVPESGARLHFTGRGLKSKSYPMRLTSNNSDSLAPGTVDYTDTLPQNENVESGASPAGSTMEMLFVPPSSDSKPNDPKGLAMNKDEFFGLEAWSTPKLMCGAPLDRNLSNYFAN